jgi:hypothetical protein
MKIVKNISIQILKLYKKKLYLTISQKYISYHIQKIKEIQ